MSGLEHLEANEKAAADHHNGWCRSLSIDAATAAYECMRFATTWNGKSGTKENYSERWNRHRKAALLRHLNNLKSI